MSMRVAAAVLSVVLMPGVYVNGATQVVLVKDGQATATIVLPAETEWDRYAAAAPETIDALARRRFPNASPDKLENVKERLPKLVEKEAQRVGDEEALAVEELVAFIQRISGAELPVVRVAVGEKLPAGTLVLLGAELAGNEGHGKDLDALSPDGYLLRSRSDRLVVSGRRARGTLYGVYALLESLGCRWFMPGPFGEIIPESATIQVAVDETGNPSHQQRYWWCTWGPGEHFNRWMLRNKGNAVRALGDPRVSQSHASQRPLQYGARTERGTNVIKQVSQWKKDENGAILRDKHGSPRERIMVEKEVRQLPDEYYAMQGGKPNLHFANMANPKVWDLCTEYYRDVFFYDHPLDDYVSISAADGIVIDDRKASRSLDSNEYDWTLGAASATDRLWFFHRRYITEVVKEHPDRKFGVLVYANNMTPPRVETVHPAMALVFAPLGICPLHHVRDEKCKTNRAYHQWFKAWMAQAEAVGAETHYYDYLPIGFQWCNFIISPQWQIVGRNYPWFHDLGLDGHTTQGFDDSGAMGLTAWVAVRLYWDAGQDYNDLVEEYCRIRFGEAAAAAMHEYYRVFERRMDEIPDICSNEIWGNHIAIDAETRATARGALAKAAKLIEGDAAKRQFDAVADFQRGMDAWCDGIDHARETGDFAAAQKVMEPAFEIAEKLNGLYTHFVHPKRIKKDSIRRYQPGGWYNKYAVWAAIVGESKASLCLPRHMKVALDTDNVSWAKGWHLPDVSVDQLEEWDVTVVPDVKYGTQREPAGFFYRTDVKVPKSFRDHDRIVLFFPCLIARALRVWINGEPLSFDNGEFEDETWRGPSYFWMNYNHSHEFDVTRLIDPGKKNTIAFRVFKSYDHGGTYDRVFLLAGPSGTEDY